MSHINTDQQMGLLSDLNLIDEKPQPATASARNAIRTFSFRNTLSGIWSVLKPECFEKRAPGSGKRPGPTAWLDGLRGVAAFCVCIMHLSVFTHQGLELCYGAAYFWQTFNTSPAAWPILRLPFTGGHFMVILFFTISGYVVPRRLISLLHEGRRDDFIEALNAAMVRRMGRLFIPVWFSTLMLAFFWHITGITTAFPEHQSNIFLELWAWWKDQMKFTYFFRGGFLFTYYNVHTWTIPVELRGSLTLFVWLFCTHQVGTRSRILLTFAMTLYWVIGAAGAWYGAFFAGMLTAELDLLSANGLHVSLPWDPIFKFFKRRRVLKVILMHLMLVSALWLASQPSSDSEDMEEVLGKCGAWGTLMKFIPDSYKEGNTTYRWFWLFWAAWMLLVSVKEIPWVRWLFETGPAQYLGRHSFSLYLVHGPMIGLLSDRLFYLTGVKIPSNDDDIKRFGHLQNKWKDASWWFLPDGGPYAMEPNYLFCVAASLPVMLYVAEVVTRTCDIPGIKISRWYYAKMKALR
ncbi:hypothetical protein AC578_9354 [Pseudocercospora eumusae]|uniref:Acyltransferase 3 domain-containing protein n=1 Tax=Pseudocercospora eumusae TaxID=321146 RepID=A0A139GW82_9PEZI|nr:hypothetical protein AC578_9354 [Pseudocercospora eumusae]